MTEQYYYAVIYFCRVMLPIAWWRWCVIVYTYPLSFISLLLVCILILILISKIRHTTVTVIEGDEIHNLIRAMNEPISSDTNKRGAVNVDG